MVEITDYRDEQRKRKSSQVYCIEIRGPSYIDVLPWHHRSSNAKYWSQWSPRNGLWRQYSQADNLLKGRSSSSQRPFSTCCCTEYSFSFRCLAAASAEEFEWLLDNIKWYRHLVRSRRYTHWECYAGNRDRCDTGRTHWQYFNIKLWQWNYNKSQTILDKLFSDNEVDTDIEAERTGDLDLYLVALHEMLPYFAAAGHILYTKVYSYIQQMLSLPVDYPNVYSMFIEGRNVICRSDRYWEGLSTDLIIEQMLMHSIKSTGGLKRGRGVTEVLEICLE